MPIEMPIDSGGGQQAERAGPAEDAGGMEPGAGTGGARYTRNEEAERIQEPVSGQRA